MLHRHRLALLNAVLILTLLLLGCALSGAPAAVQPTTIAQATAAPANVAQTTPAPVDQTTPTNMPPAPTPTTDTTVSATPTAEGCTLGASYMADITIPDDTVLEPKAAFVKTWRMKNSGTCEWKPGMKLIYVSGDPLGGPASVDVPVVPLNSPVDISVNFVAPATPGTYRSSWRMQSPDGTLFGSTPYVQIIVPEPVVPGATNTPPAPTSPDWKIYKLGSKGVGVYALQYLLRAEGYTLGIDGTFGPETEAAVKDFQSARSLQSDGVVGEKTWTALVKAHGLQSGNTGDAVRALQYLLNNGYGYSDVIVDGKFGNKTNLAVLDFQTKHGLVVDGSIGVNSWKNLIGNLGGLKIINPHIIVTIASP